jgi:hypothetical protein
MQHFLPCSLPWRSVLAIALRQRHQPDAGAWRPALISSARAASVRVVRMIVICSPKASVAVLGGAVKHDRG